MLQEEIINELNQISADKLAELYDLIHYFRLGLQHEKLGNPAMQLAGAWQDLPDNEFQEFLNDLQTRRHQGFSGRRTHVAMSD